MIIHLLQWRWKVANSDHPPTAVEVEGGSDRPTIAVEVEGGSDSLTTYTTVEVEGI